MRSPCRKVPHFLSLQKDKIGEKKKSKQHNWRKWSHLCPRVHLLVKPFCHMISSKFKADRPAVWCFLIFPWLLCSLPPAAVLPFPKKGRACSPGGGGVHKCVSLRVSVFVCAICQTAMFLLSRGLCTSQPACWEGYIYYWRWSQGRFFIFPPQDCRGFWHTHTPWLRSTSALGHLPHLLLWEVAAVFRGELKCEGQA
jgi:hypothetical protein